MRFNPDKFQSKVNEASFFELTWTSEGIRPQENKIKAIRNMPPPKERRRVAVLHGHDQLPQQILNHHRLLNLDAR